MVTTASRERTAVRLVAIGSGLAAVLVGARPTGAVVGDVGAAFVLGAGVAVAAARGARWGRVWALSIALVASSGWWTLVALFALVAGTRHSVRPWHRAALGAALSQVLLHLPGDRVARNVALAALAIAFLVGSSDEVAATLHRSRRSRAWIAAAGVLVLVIGGVLTAGVLARHDLIRGMAAANAGLEDARVGDSDRAAAQLDTAASSFRSAHGVLDAWWTQPARAVPGVGRHVRALAEVSSVGADLARAAATSARTARVQDIRVVDGRIDLERIRSLAGPLADVQTALASARRAIAKVDSRWLIAPVADRVDAFRRDLDVAASDAETASAAVEVLPDVLGGSGTRRYFVAFGTPAETRELGGFMGAYGILRADHGDLSLEETGRVRDLNRSFRGRRLWNPSVVPAHLRALAPDRFWQNVTGTADFPTVAAVVDQMWATQPDRGRIDGVLYLDPQALASLLKLTGPIRVPDYDKPLTAETAAPFLLRGQYVAFPDDDRHDFLVEAAETVFHELTTGELPRPQLIGEALAPAVRQRRLLVHAFRDDEQALFARLRVDGAMPEVHGDFLSVRASNRGLSKIDAMMRRTVSYEARVDPTRSWVDASLRVTIRNDAPASGLPLEVIGNHLGRPMGTNSTTVAVYTPLQLVDVRQDGTSIGRGAGAAYGRSRYTALVDVPAGREVTVVFELEGRLDLRGGYHLDVVPQPLVDADRLHVEVHAVAPWRLHGDRVLDVDLRRTQRMDASFRFRP